jgi:hypothetical protein
MKRNELDRWTGEATNTPDTYTVKHYTAQQMQRKMILKCGVKMKAGIDCFRIEGFCAHGDETADYTETKNFSTCCTTRNCEQVRLG